MKIYSETRKIDTLTKPELAAMLGLLSLEFLGVDRAQFLKDLEEKESVMLLRADDHKGDIVGFSTIMTLDLPVKNRKVKAIFSGDTTVLPHYRRSIGIGVEAVGYFLEAMERFPGHEIFYVLISKGWRTYKILPFFFKKFAPRFDEPTSLEDKAIIDAFGAKKYPRYYDVRTGLIMFPSETQRLIPGSIDALPPSHADEHIEFFMRKNPTYLSGTELVCTARVAFRNFTEAAIRIADARTQRRP